MNFLFLFYFFNLLNEWLGKFQGQYEQHTITIMCKLFSDRPSDSHMESSVLWDISQMNIEYFQSRAEPSEVRYVPWHQDYGTTQCVCK